MENLAESFGKLLRGSDSARKREQLMGRIDEICHMEKLSLEEKELLINKCFEDMRSADHDLRREAQKIFDECRQPTRSNLLDLG